MFQFGVRQSSKEMSCNIAAIEDDHAVLTVSTSSKHRITKKNDNPVKKLACQYFSDLQLHNGKIPKISLVIFGAAEQF